MGDRATSWDEPRNAVLFFSWATAIASILAVALLDARGLDWRPWLGFAAFSAVCLGFVLIVPHLPRRAALAMFGGEALLALVLISMTADMLAATGRPFAPFNGNKILALLVAILCPSLRLGTVLIGACIIGAVAQTMLWPTEVRSLMPELEPAQTLVTAGTALVFLHIRRRHARRVEELARIQAETTSLERVAALGVRVRERMQVLIDDLQRALAALQPREPSTAPMMERMARAVGSLERVRETLTPLRDHEASKQTAREAEATEARRAIITVGLLSLVGGVLFAIAILVVAPDYPRLPPLLIAASGLAALAIAHARPQLSIRACHALFGLVALAIDAGVLINNDAMAERGHFDAFPGLKLALLAFAFIAPSGAIGAIVIGVGALAPVLATYVWWTAEQRAHLPLLEPWSTVLIGATALALLYAQRRRTAALRHLEAARAERDGLARTAHLVLALRDLVNTPLQILVMSADLVKTRLDSDEANTIDVAVARLRDLIRALPTVDAETAARPDALAFHALDAVEHEVRRVIAARLPTPAAT